LAEALQEKGISVVHDSYPGYPHVFWSVPTLKATAKFHENLVKGLLKLQSY